MRESGAGHYLAKHVRQNPAMLIVIDLDRGVDAAAHRHVIHRTVAARDAQGQVLLRAQRRGETEHVVLFMTIEFQGLGGDPLLELERQHAHADEVRAVDPLEALGHHNLYP